MGLSVATERLRTDPRPVLERIKRSYLQENAPRELNLPEDLKRALRNAIKQQSAQPAHVDPAEYFRKETLPALLAAGQHVVHLLFRNSFPRFLASAASNKENRK